MSPFWIEMCNIFLDVRGWLSLLIMHLISMAEQVRVLPSDQTGVAFRRAGHGDRSPWAMGPIPAPRELFSEPKPLAPVPIQSTFRSCDRKLP
jgi:hypothetical protein